VRVSDRVKIENFRNAKTPGALGRVFAELEARGGAALWAWSRALLGVYEAGQARLHDRLTLRQLGDEVGIAARGRAFSAPWVSRALSSAREWPKAPRSREERTAFALRFHGHNRPAKTAEEDAPEIQLRRVLTRLRNAAAEAAELGCDIDRVVLFIRNALTGCPERDDDDTAGELLRQARRKRRAAEPHLMTTTATTAMTATPTTSATPTRTTGSAGAAPAEPSVARRRSVCMSA